MQNQTGNHQNTLQKQKIKLTLLTGFLGTGKTTLLKRLLREQNVTTKFGVIVNDLSELEVDGELIRIGHAVSEVEGTLVSLHNGSISDKKRTEFSEALKGMKNVEHVLVEASGGSHPTAIIEELLKAEDATLCAVIALVDARTLLHDYEGGPAFLQRLVQNDNSGRQSVENLLSSQLRVATIIAISKVDTVSNKDLEGMLQTVQVLNPSAKLLTTAYGKMDAKLLLNAPPYQRPEQPSYLREEKAAATENFDIGSEVLADPRPFHPKRLYTHYYQNLGLGIFRSKGFIWLASRSNDVLLWNQSGGFISLELLGTWRAAVLENPAISAEERKGLQEMMAAKHLLFGDRANEITVIGHARDRKIFMKGLYNCLCTAAEIQQWQEGYDFEDPWPKTVRRMS